MADAPAPGPPKPPYPTRFGWGMRALLSFLIFIMFFRGFSVLWPTDEWAADLDMSTMPRRLPTRAELAELRAGASEDNPDPVREDLMRTLDSAWDYFRPWPGPDTRARMRTRTDVGKWALTWMSSRLELFENVAGFNEEWPMFSPSVSRKKYVARARLVYADGGEKVVRGKCDPEDLTRYSHWWEEKVLDHELKIKEGGEGKGRDNAGYCNLLAHRFPVNENGSPLRTIYLFLVRYDLTPPGADAREWLSKQSGPPPEQVYKDFFAYDVPTRTSTILLRSYD
jgi:hypothetical protein